MLSCCLLACAGFDQTGGLPARLDPRQGPIHQAIQTGQVIVLSSDQDGLQWLTLSTPLGSFRPTQVLVVPLLAKQQPVVS